MGAITETRKASQAFGAAREAMSGVALRAHVDHSGPFVRYIEPGTQVNTQFGALILDRFSVGGVDTNAAVVVRPEVSNVSRLVTVGFHTEHSPKGSQSVATVGGEGTVTLSGEKYRAKNTGRPLFVAGSERAHKIEEIASNAASGLLVAEVVETVSAHLASKEPETEQLDDARKGLEDLIGKPITLSPNVAVRLEVPTPSR
jgi:hypothetical protein